jgi:hypothetical protein
VVNVRWSFYLRADKAVKVGYAGFEWDQTEFEKKVSEATDQLAILEREPKTIDPGDYRVDMAPAHPTTTRARSAGAATA